MHVCASIPAEWQAAGRAGKARVGAAPDALAVTVRVAPHLQYLDAARRVLDELEQTQAEAIVRVAGWCTETILAGGLVHLFGSGHSRMAVEEMYPRYGSFPGFHPMVELSLSNHHQVVGSNGQRQAMFIENAEGLGRVILCNFALDTERDLMIVISASGTNAVPVEVAIASREMGLRVVGITSLAHSSASQSKHSSHLRLFEVAHQIIDLCTPPGDAAVSVPGLDTPVAPLTSLAGVAVINAIKAETALLLTEAGQPPTVITSSVLVGHERSRELFDRSYAEYRERTRRL